MVKEDVNTINMRVRDFLHVTLSTSMPRAVLALGCSFPVLDLLKASIPALCTYVL